MAASATLPPSLLDRVRANDPRAWGRLVGLYTPLVYLWVRADGVPEADAPDAAQDVFLDVARSLTHFRRDRTGDSFTGWVRTIARRRAVDHARARGRVAVAAGGSDALRHLHTLPDPPAPDPEDLPDPAAALVRRGLDLIRGEFAPATWAAFEATALGGRPPADVAAELGLTVGAVYVARSRVRKRLREELDGLL